MTDNAHLRAAATRLSEPPTDSTRHMEHGERVDGIEQMLRDLDQLVRRDGCIAAAWALEKLLSEHRDDDGEAVDEPWLVSVGANEWDRGDIDRELFDLWFPMQSEIGWRCRLAYSCGSVYAVRMMHDDEGRPHTSAESVQVMGHRATKGPAVTRGEFRKLCEVMKIPLTEPKGTTP